MWHSFTAQSSLQAPHIHTLLLTIKKNKSRKNGSRETRARCHHIHPNNNVSSWKLGPKEELLKQEFFHRGEFYCCYFRAASVMCFHSCVISWLTFCDLSIFDLHVRNLDFFFFSILVIVVFYLFLRHFLILFVNIIWLLFYKHFIQNLSCI